MTRHPLTRTTSRRGFLAGAGLAVAAACSNGGGSEEAAGAGDGTAATGADGSIGGGIASGDLYDGERQRVAFGLLRDGEVVRDAPVSVGFRAESGETIAPKPATWRADGLADQERDGIYTLEATFPTPGVWDAVVDVNGEEGTFPFQVRDEPRMPAPGDEAVVAASPTSEEPLGVDPICTRTPPCPLHEVSLDEALAADKPVAVMFSTPARCQSRWCGPVLEVVLDARERYEGDLTLVHVEIFQDLESNQLVPTVSDWGLVTEPWLYGVDADGRIASRIDGAFDATEVRELLDGLVA